MLHRAFRDLPAPPARPLRSGAGQASIGLVATLPLLLLLALALAHAALLAAGGLSATHAARSAARAVAVGESPRAAARQALPGHLVPGLRTSTERGRTRVQVRVEGPGPSGPLRLGARTALRPRAGDVR